MTVARNVLLFIRMLIVSHSNLYIASSRIVTCSKPKGILLLRSTMEMMSIASTSIKITMPVFEELKAIQTKLIEERKRHVTFTEVVQDLLVAYYEKHKIN
jgi:hypothetical protein